VLHCRTFGNRFISQASGRILKKRLSTKATRAYIANLLLTPFLGTFLGGTGDIWRSTDVSVFSVFVILIILTFVPVIIATALGNFICQQLKKIEDKFNVLTWHLSGVFLGSLVGALVGVVMKTIAAATLTGAVLGLVDAFIWWDGEDLKDTVRFTQA
jgi:hypothetical protein